MRKGYTKEEHYFTVVGRELLNPISRPFKTFKGAKHERERFLSRMTQYTKRENTAIIETIVYFDKGENKE